MDDIEKDDGVHIELKVSIYGSSDDGSILVAETAMEASDMMQAMGICGADVVVGLLMAATAILDDHTSGGPVH